MKKKMQIPKEILENEVDNHIRKGNSYHLLHYPSTIYPKQPGNHGSIIQ